MSFKISSNPKCPCLCHSCLLFPRLCTGCACRSLEHLQAAGQALCSQSCWQVIPWVIVFSCPHLAVYCSQPFPDSSGHSPSLFWAGRMWHRVPLCRAPAATSRTPRGKGRAQACVSQERQVRRNDRGQASSDGETVSAPSAQVGAWQGCPLVASKWA